MEYLQFVAFGELAEWADFVDAEGDDLQIGHFLDDLQIFELVAPQVEILDAVEIIAFGFGQHQLHRQSLALRAAHYILNIQRNIDSNTSANSLDNLKQYQTWDVFLNLLSIGLWIL